MAEETLLTVLFSDLVGSTQLSSQFDPEDWRDIVRAYQQVSVAVLQRLGGHIAQYQGDGLLVYFGYPQVQADDAQHAVQAGLGIVTALTRSTSVCGRAKRSSPSPPKPSLCCVRWWSTQDSW